MGRKEQTAVSYLRVAVYSVVVITAVVVSLGAYIYSKQQQEQNFMNVFETNANKLADSFLDSVQQKISALGSLSTSITNYALTNGLTFPNVTIENWETVGVKTRVQADGFVIEWAPLVTDADREGWEEYAYHHRDWQQRMFQSEESYTALQDNHFGLDPIPVNNDPPKTPDGGDFPGYTKGIFAPGKPRTTRDIMPVGSGPFAPLWQMSPILPHNFLLNRDLLTRPVVKDAIQAVIQHKKIALSKASGVADPNNVTLAERKFIDIANDSMRRGQHRHDQGFYNGDPTTSLTYPVFDTFAGFNRTLAGFLIMPLLWRLNFENVLPDGQDDGLSLIAVMKNSANQSFSYRVDGPKVTYLGFKDEHSPKYDDMYVFQNMAQTIDAKKGPHSQAFDDVELDTDVGRYYLYVYPSEVLESEHITNEPALLAVMVASIFIFTLAVLVAFDFLVARRQRVVMQKAVESRALVSTLYPKQVRDRLFKNDERSDERKSWKDPKDSSFLKSSASTDKNNNGRAICDKW